MSSAEILRKLREKRAELHQADPEMVAPVEEVAQTEGRFSPEAADKAAIMEESIALRKERPVLAIRDDRCDLQFRNKEDSTLWRARLDGAGAQITKAARAI